MTIRDDLIRAILARGETKVETSASNYKVFTRKYRRVADGTLEKLGSITGYYIVTRGGSLRLCSKPSRNGSITSSTLRGILLNEAKGKP